MEELAEGRRVGLLFQTEEERLWLAGAVERLHVPRSFLILEAVQAGLGGHSLSIPGRRNRGVSFRLPAEVAEKVKQAAQVRGVSQQSLIRHLLFTYLTEALQRPPRQRTPPRKPAQAARLEGGVGNA